MPRGKPLHPPGRPMPLWGCGFSATTFSRTTAAHGGSVRSMSATWEVLPACSSWAGGPPWINCWLGSMTPLWLRRRSRSEQPRPGTTGPLPRFINGRLIKVGSRWTRAASRPRLWPRSERSLESGVAYWSGPVWVKSWAGQSSSPIRTALATADAGKRPCTCIPPPRGRGSVHNCCNS